ncbi:MAG: class I SAM-dependent methyltransferase [Chloroflexi bacterium]|nr:MAG: class I SAM-dependent methyltransferase [Chloroflexota bacterium]
MIWLLVGTLAIAGLAVLFVMLTDGRYFGKRLTRWVYDRLGPAIFSAQSEAERWQRLARMLQLRGDESILDVGTAVGDLPLTIATMPGFHGRVVGIDWSPRMMAAAQAEAARRGLSDRVTFQVADVREPLPFEAGEFDVVVCLGLLETLPRPGRVLRELNRVLKPRGALVLSLYRGWSAWHTALSLEWYQEHLAELGLGNLQVGPCRRNQDVVIARLERRKQAGQQATSN